MTLDDLESALQQGIADTINVAFAFSGDLYGDIYPEYLKTVKVAEAIRAKTQNGTRIALETWTYDALGRHLFFPRRKDWTSDIDRSGKVDICVSTGDDVFASPVLIVENKRYPNQFSKIEDDLKRCDQFLRSEGDQGHGSIAATAVTYLLKVGSQEDVTLEHHTLRAQILAMKVRKAAAAMAQGPVRHKHLFQVFPRVVYDSRDHADTMEGDEAPLWYLYPPHSVVGICELFWRDDRMRWLSYI